MLSLLLAILIGVPAGVIAAVAAAARPSDYCDDGGALIGHSVPHFWLGLLLIIWFAVDLHWLPATGYSSITHPLANLRHMVLPVHRARLRRRRGAVAPDAVVDARLARRRLRPHRAGERPAASGASSAARAAQQPDHGGDR